MNQDFRFRRLPIDDRLAIVTRDAIEESVKTILAAAQERFGQPSVPEPLDIEKLQRERDALAYAVWMVGNMDTEQDKDAWWEDFDKVWRLAGARVEDMVKRGVVCGQGFAATGIEVEDIPAQG